MVTPDEGRLRQTPLSQKLRAVGEALGAESPIGREMLNFAEEAAQLEPTLVAGDIESGSIDRPSVSGTLEAMMMAGNHDPEELSVSLPVGNLNQLMRLIQDLEQRCIGNGQVASEKTRSLVQLRDRFSDQENKLRAVSNELALVWELIETWEKGSGSKEAPAYEAASRLRSTLNETLKPQEQPWPFSRPARPWPYNPEAITRVPSAAELVVGTSAMKPCPDCGQSGYSMNYDGTDNGACTTCNGEGVVPSTEALASLLPGKIVEVPPALVFEPAVVHGAIMEKLEETDPFSDTNNELAKDITEAVRKVVVR